MPGKQIFLRILWSLDKAGSQCHMTNIIPVIMLAFQTRVMGDRQASGLETDSTEGRTVKERAGAWSRVPRSSYWIWWGPDGDRS